MTTGTHEIGVPPLPVGAASASSEKSAGLCSGRTITKSLACSLI